MTAAADPHDARRALRAGGALAQFNAAGVLAAADVHVARRLCELAGCGADEPVVLAVAFAVRGPRIGHVHVDLATIRETATVDLEDPVDLSGLPWPDPGAWVASVAASPLAGPVAARPLRLDGTRLYLDRYHAEERQVADDLLERAARPAAGVDEAQLDDGLARLFAGARDGRQAAAAATAVARRLAVVAGGPGTGKTTTVARIAALLFEQARAAGRPEPLVALAAPTGKGAARLEEAVHAEAAGLEVAAEVRAALLGLEGRTLHRLLGRRRDSASRFRHDRANRLPHEVVIVDETSMVSLSLMARLLEAVRPDARLVLVGDPGQLASIEAGTVLGDVVGPASPGEPLSHAIVVLEQVHRYRGAIAELAEAVRAGDGDAVMSVLREGREGVRWIDVDPGDGAALGALTPVRDAAVQAGRALVGAAQAGDARAALDALGGFRLLCAHRRGDHGVSTWTARVEQWLGVGAAGRWYPGRPLLVTENDYELRLFNGDTGAVVAAGDRVAAAFERRGELVEISPARLGVVETAHAMTIHKSQGSQFRTAAVLLPGPDARILTRELLYTAVTRAQELLIVAGTEAAIRRAVARPVARASGLRARLWPRLPS